MISESLYFYYDGEKSTDYGVLNVSMSSGLFDENFLAPSNIVEQKIRGNDKPYFSMIDREPLSFKLTLFLQDGFDENKLRLLARWFRKDFYKPMIFSENLDRIFYCVCVGNSRLLHNGAGQGYIELEFRCDSPYMYSSVEEETFDTSISRDITFINSGDLQCKPIIIIEKTLSDGDVSIINESDDNKTLAFEGLEYKEIVIVDCENEEIETDKTNTYRYDNHNGLFLSLPVGINNLRLIGDFKVTFKYEFKYLQG